MKGRLRARLALKQIQSLRDYSSHRRNYMGRKNGPEERRPLIIIRKSTLSLIYSKALIGTTANWKFPIHHSERISKKESVFIAHATALPSPELLPALLQGLKEHPSLKRASHCMYAYRTFPKNFPEFSHILLGQSDGGERGSGECLSRLLEVMECKNVIVVVSRWYGGVNLGSERWRLISGVAKEAVEIGGFGKKCGDPKKGN